ncbi:MAG: M48 family metalloprotease [Alphaproteobacteria bacterium]|nr:M48 family metalloprotease [Alphaproteobacteria bacterium]
MNKRVRNRFSLLRSLAYGFTVLCLSSAVSLPAAASRQSPNFIRDAEIEHTLRTYATPLFHAAAIDPSSVSIVLIQDNELNAFVAGGMNIFIYTGLLQSTDNAGQVIGVIAHELGHIAGGHLVRGAEAMKNASAQAVLGTIIGIAAGALARDTGAAAATIGGSAGLAERNFLSFSRTQEASADSAGLNYLDRAGFSASGMLEFLDKLADQELLPYDRKSEFVRTHPLTHDRVEIVRHHVEESPFKDKKFPEEFNDMHERMKAKLMGYIQPDVALLRYTDKDKKITTRYARAIALYRTSQLDRALPLVDGLIKEEPDNPFFYELRGQMLYENSRVEEAVGSYAKAVELLGDSALLRTAYAQALLESKDKSLPVTDKAIDQLQESLRLEPREPLAWRLMATAWGRKGQITENKEYDGMVVYALAEEAVARGADKEANQLAERAIALLPKDSTYWIRAQDIRLSTKEDE